jgi:UDP-N-acetylglucosamine 2-epimerase
LSDEFKQNIQNATNPYGSGGASAKIAEKITTLCFDGLINKHFFDSAHIEN